MTPVPESALQQLDTTAESRRGYELLGFDGRSSVAPVVRLDMVFLGRTFRGQFLLTSGPRGILGRNVPNAVSLVLDGPRLTWKEI